MQKHILVTIEEYKLGNKTYDKATRDDEARNIGGIRKVLVPVLLAYVMNKVYIVSR